MDEAKAMLARLVTYLNEQPFGTPHFRKVSLAHRALTDLIAAGGGSPAYRVRIARRLLDIESGRVTE